MAITTCSYCFNFHNLYCYYDCYLSLRFICNVPHEFENYVNKTFIQYLALPLIFYLCLASSFIVTFNEMIATLNNLLNHL